MLDGQVIELKCEVELIKGKQDHFNLTLRKHPTGRSTKLEGKIHFLEIKNFTKGEEEHRRMQCSSWRTKKPIPTDISWLPGTIST